MRIAYVSMDRGVPVFGTKGCSVHVQEVTRELLRRDHRVEMFTTRLGGEPTCDLASLKVHKIRLNSSADRAEAEQAFIVANNSLLKLLRSEGPFDLIYERYSLFSSAAMQYAQATRTPSVLEVNSPLIEEQARYRLLVHQGEAEEMTEQAIRSAGTVIAVSEQVASFARPYRAAGDEVFVVPNGVDIRRFENCQLPRPERAAGGLTIGFVGTLKQWHGVADLVAAFGKLGGEHPSTRLLIVGDGPEREALAQQVAALPDTIARRVEFAGAVPPQQIPSLLARMDIAVAPYGQLTDFYFSPLKIYEYMAAGLPTVTSDVGELPELINEGVTGLIYPAGNIAALASSLSALMQSSELRCRLGLAALECVSQHCTWQNVVSRVFELANQSAGTGRYVPVPHFRLAREKSPNKITL